MTGPEFYRMLTMRSALRLEVLGMRHSRGSVYALVKREFGFRGNKQAVLDQLSLQIQAIQELQAAAKKVTS